MSLIQCPECSKQISDLAESCPNCGYPINKHNTSAWQEEPEDDDYVESTLNIVNILSGFSLNEEIVCPYCQKYGCVATKRAKKKKGISGAKMTGALLTGGLSLFATGLSRKEKITDAICKNCGSEWQF